MFAKSTHTPTHIRVLLIKVTWIDAIDSHRCRIFPPEFRAFFLFDPKLSIKQECPSNVFYCTKCECVCALLRACVIYVHMWIFCHRFRSVFIGVAGVKCAILAVLRYENVLAKPKQMHQQQQQQRPM